MKFIIYLPHSDRYITGFSSKNSDKRYNSLGDSVDDAYIFDNEYVGDDLGYVSLKDIFQTEEMFIKLEVLD